MDPVMFSLRRGTSWLDVTRADRNNFYPEHTLILKERVAWSRQTQISTAVAGYGKDVRGILEQLKRNKSC